jgi:predicted ArsR family transcriptional regulator
MDVMLFEGQVLEAKLTRDQLACLASASRAEVYWNFTPSEPQSISDIAKQIGRSAAAVTYHVNELVRVGILIAVSERKRRSRTEKLYVLQARNFVTKSIGFSPEYDGLILDGYNALLRLMSRERDLYQKAFIEFEDLRGLSTWRRQSVKVSHDKAKEFMERIRLELREFAASPTEDDGVHVAFSFFAIPTLGETRPRLKKSRTKLSK